MLGKVGGSCSGWKNMNLDRERKRGIITSTVTDRCIKEGKIL